MPQPSRAGRRPTIADVAKAAGVSPTTVSHSMNGLGKVDPRTRERVKQVAGTWGTGPTSGLHPRCGRMRARDLTRSG
jgi:hypothetical protein